MNALKFLLNVLLFLCVAIIIVQAQDLSNGLVGYYAFSGNANDSSPLALNGTVTGATLTNDSNGNSNSAYHFDGSNDYICTNENNRGITDQLTVTAWFRTTSSAYQHIVSKYIHTEDKGYHLIVKFNQVHLAGRDGNGEYQILTYETPITDGQWHCVVGVIDQDKWQLWVDCELRVEIFTFHTYVDLTTSQPFCIGQFFAGDSGDHLYFNGDLDEIRLYNRPLIPEEIMIYCNNIPFEATIMGNTNICEGESSLLQVITDVPGSYTYLWENGSTESSISVTQSGEYVVEVALNAYCPKTATIQVNVNENTTFTNPQTICPNQSIAVGSNTYNQTGTYTDILTAQNGCDSVVTTILTVLPNISFTNPQTICPNQSITVGSNTYNQTGTYTDILTAQNGCDSVVTTILTVTEVLADAGIDQSICAGQTIVLGGNSIGDLFSWLPTDGLNDPISANPTATLTQTTTYTLTATNLDGTCSVIDEVTIIVTDLSYPGTMPTDIQILCDDESSNLSADGAVLSENTVLAYILHTSATHVIGNILATNPNSGQFAIADNTLILPNVTYYVSSVSGPVGSTAGVPDFNHLCTQVAIGTPIVFLAPLDLLIDEYCDWGEGDFYLTAYPIGGYPVYDSTAQYILGGDINNTLYAGQSSTIVLAGSTSTQAYSISLLSDGWGCGTVNNANTFICFKTPIELLRFVGIAMPEGNVLKWATGSETDNAYFTLSRSVNGLDFQKIATLAGAGNSISERSYEFWDNSAPQGLSYYSLAQTDFNGTTTESPIITITRAPIPNSNFGAIIINPTPSSDIAYLSFPTNNTAKTARVEILAANGQVISNQNWPTNLSGITTMAIDVSHLVAGIYFVRIETQQTTLIGKLMKE